MAPLLTTSGSLSAQTLREENSIRCEKIIFALTSRDARHIAGLGPEDSISGREKTRFAR